MRVCVCLCMNMCPPIQIVKYEDIRRWKKILVLVSRASWLGIVSYQWDHKEGTMTFYHVKLWWADRNLRENRPPPDNTMAGASTSGFSDFRAARSKLQYKVSATGTLMSRNNPWERRKETLLATDNLLVLKLWKTQSALICEVQTCMSGQPLKSTSLAAII